jgi:glycosyltransferase involved in cell wall biosynthesis
MSQISESLLDGAALGAQTARSSKHASMQASVAWFLGPRPASWNGVMRYSLDCLEMMKQFDDLAIQAIDIPAASRSLKRYWTQFVLYPLRAMYLARKVNIVVLYQEDLAFMIPFVKLMGGSVCIVTHHVACAKRTRGFVETMKARYMRMLQPLISRADLVISTSDVTTQDAMTELGVKRERIELVPNAFDDCIAQTDAALRQRARKYLQERFHLFLGDATVLLNVGTDETRKNNVTLFRALAALGRKDIVLLRVGKAMNTSNRRECEEIAHKAGIIAHFLDGASDADLAYCYQAADAYVSPTLQEGFGRTVIEAQLVGLPVIASDLPVYRYTMKDTFIAVQDPMHVSQWVGQIACVVDDARLRQDLAHRGRKNALRFSSASVSSDLHRALNRIARPGKK